MLRFFFIFFVFTAWFQLLYSIPNKLRHNKLIHEDIPPLFSYEEASKEIYNYAYLEEQAEKNISNKSKNCDEEIFLHFLADLKAISPEGIIRLALRESPKSLCRELSTGLDGMDAYMQGCELSRIDGLYIQLLKGVNILHDKICVNEKFNKRFNKTYNCAHKLHEEFFECDGPAGWTENTDNNIVCSSLRYVMDCFYLKTATLCGISDAHNLKRLMLTVLTTILRNKCGNLETIRDPRVANPLPAGYTSSSNTIQIKFTLILFTFFTLLFSELK